MDPRSIERPSNNADIDYHIDLLEYFPLEDLQQVQDHMAASNAVSLLTTDPDGNPLTMPSNETEACRRFRMSSQGEAACLTQMRSMALRIQREPQQICQASCPLGFFKAAMPITIDQIQVATLWISKQCFYKSAKPDPMIRSDMDGSDTDRLQTELSALPVCSKDIVAKTLDCLRNLAKLIVQTASQNIILSRYTGRLDRLENELDRYKAQMEDLVDARTLDLINANKRLQLEVIERDLVEEQIARKSKLIDAINQVLQQTLAASGEKNLSGTFLKAAREITGSAFGFIVEKSHGRWELTAAALQAGDGLSLAVGQHDEPFDISGVWQEVIDAGEPVCVHDPEKRFDWHPLPVHFPHIQSMLVVPLLKDRQVLGLVTLVNSAHGYSAVDSGDMLALAQAFWGALIRKRMETAKYQSEQRLNLAMDSANQGLWDYFPHSGQLYFSPSWFSMLGYYAHEFPTSMETWTTLTHPNDVDALEGALKAVACGAVKDFGIEIRMLGKEGHWHWIHALGRAVAHDSDHTVVRIVGTLSDISKYKRIELALQKANEELQRLAALDSLTQIANRRRFDDRLNQEWRRARREGKPLALVLCDIDYFKKYNDTYGHLKGDDALHAVAQTLSDLLKRPMDLVARYGGEEFGAILPNTNIKGAMRVANEFKAAVDALKIPHQTSDICGHVTLSYGVAALIPGRDDNPKDLIEAADKALYRAKAMGRNTIVKFPGQITETDIPSNATTPPHPAGE